MKENINDYDESYHYKLGPLEQKLESGSGMMLIFILMIVGFGLFAILGNLDQTGKMIMSVLIVILISQVIRYYLESRKIFNLYEKGVVFGNPSKLRAIEYSDIIDVVIISKKEGQIGSRMTFYYSVVTLENNETIKIPWPGFHEVLAKKLPELVKKN